MSSRRGLGRHARERLRMAVLDGDALAPFIRADPARAAELLRLAVVDPLARTRGMFEDEGSLHITDAPHWLGPVPERGPFGLFLGLAPQVALELTIEIVEMATARWAESCGEQLEPQTDGGEDDGGGDGEQDAAPDRPSQPRCFEVLVDGQPVQLVGDAEVLHWHRGEGRVPTVLATMLMAVEVWLYGRLDAGEDVEADLARLLTSRSAALWGLAAEVAAFRPQLLSGPLSALVTGGELLIADRTYRWLPHDYLMIAALGQHGWGDRIRSWNTMEHRKRSLFETLMADVISEGPLAEVLQAARERWAQREPEGLKHLLAQTDLANREIRQVGEGEFLLEYVPPAEVAQEVAESDRQMQASGLWLMGPHQMRELIDTGQQLPEEVIESWWALVAGPLAAGMPEDMAVEGVIAAADVECGVAAVLVRCGSGWLKRHPEAQAWCRERLLAPLISPPPPHPFDGSDAFASDTWDSFGADALPVLLAANPADRELRSAVALLLRHRHRATTQRLMLRVSQQPALADDLRRLEHLALVSARWLAYHHERRAREEAASYEWAQAFRVEDLPDVETPTREAVEAFESGELSTEVPRLAEWVAGTPDGLVRARRRRDRALSILDAEYLMAAFDHLLALRTPLAAEELERRLTFAEDLAGLIAEGMQPDEDGEVSGTPYGHEHTALERLGATAVRAPAERSAAVWQPLLAPGAPAEYWVEWFLRAVWRAAVDVPPEHAGRLMSEMVAFAEEQETWSCRASGHTGIALALVGLDQWGSGAEPDPATGAIIAEAREAWIRWVSRELADGWFAERALRFLATEAADSVLEPLLLRLAELEPDRQSGFRSRYDEALGEMLAGLAVRRRELFVAPGASGDALRLLLSRLTERGSALALELVSQLA